MTDEFDDGIEHKWSDLIWFTFGFIIGGGFMFVIMSDNVIG